MRKVMVVLVITGCLPALAAELFGAPRALTDMEWTVRSPWTKRGRAVSIHADRLRRGASLRLGLFADAIYDATPDYSEFSADGRTVLYTGTLAGTDHGTACFAVTGEVISGVVWAGKGRRFLVRPSDGGSMVEEVDEQGYPPPQEVLLPAAREWLPATETSRDDSLVFTMDLGGATIDIIDPKVLLLWSEGLNAADFLVSRGSEPNEVVLLTTASPPVSQGASP